MNKTVSKSQFKAKALEVFREIEATGESVVVTDHGQPTIEVRPYKKNDVNPLQRLKGSVVEFIDPTEPVGETDWEMLR